jgi:3-hydroxyacyl-CoA dehydrogenase
VKDLTDIKKISVIGAGLMGHGIAQVAAQVGKYEVSLIDVEQRFVNSGMNMIKDSLQRFVKKGQLSEAETKAISARIHPTLELEEAVSNSDLIIEAVPENLTLQHMR